MYTRRRRIKCNIRNRAQCVGCAAIAALCFFFFRNIGGAAGNQAPSSEQAIESPQNRWSIDAVATVCSGEVYAERLLPTWLASLRQKAKWRGPIVIACDQCDLMRQMPAVKSDTLIRLVSMETEARAAAHDVRKEGHGLNLEKRFWKFSMILKVRVFVIDVCAPLHSSFGSDDSILQPNRVPAAGCRPRYESNTCC